MRFLIEIVIGLCVAATLVPILGAPQQKVLVDICGTQERAHFWSRYTWTLLFLAPLLFALLSGGGPTGPDFGSEVLQTTLKAALLGELIALIAVGLMMAKVTRDRLVAGRRTAVAATDGATDRPPSI